MDCLPNSVSVECDSVAWKDKCLRRVRDVMRTMVTTVMSTCNWLVDNGREYTVMKAEWTNMAT